MGASKPSSKLISADYQHIQDQSDTPSILFSLGVPRGEWCFSIIQAHSYHRHCMNDEEWAGTAQQPLILTAHLSYALLPLHTANSHGSLPDKCWLVTFIAKLGKLRQGE